tara:strand:- start:431 stop:625 length:195 start_codon:yes stop_codon:yes gene_type:complete
MNKLSIEQRLEGWGFDMERLRESEGGAFSSLDRRSPRAFSTNVSNDLPNYCHYSGLRTVKSYME